MKLKKILNYSLELALSNKYIQSTRQSIEPNMLYAKVEVLFYFIE